MALERLVVIDGYNVIHRTPSLRPGKDRTLREAREKLVNLLSWVIGGADAQFLVIFDGAERGEDEPSGRVQVRYSRPPQKADDLIRTIVEDQVDRVERLTVVTSDLEVARHARAMGADVAIADLFMASALGPTQSGASKTEASDKPSTLSRKELEEWAEIFKRRGKATNGESRDEEDPTS